MPTTRDYIPTGGGGALSAPDTTNPATGQPYSGYTTGNYIPTGGNVSGYPPTGNPPAQPPGKEVETPPKPEEGTTGNPTTNVKWNVPIPLSVRNQTLYGNADANFWGFSQYGDTGFNAPGFIVRDISMQDQIKEAATNGWAKAVDNWGFRFHFNPTNFSESYVPPVGLDWVKFIMDIAQNPLLAQGFQGGSTFSFQILLARAEDQRILRQDHWQNDYPTWGPFPLADRDEILEKGTQYDIERFFRVVNLDPVKTWREEESSDWGMMMATPVMIFLGDSIGSRKFRAQIQSINIQHQMYTPGMVPVYSRLDIQALRIPDPYKGTSASDQDQGNGAAEPGQDTGTTPTTPGTGPGRAPKSGWFLPVDKDWKIYLGFHTEGKTNYALGAHSGIDLWKSSAPSKFGPVYAVQDGTIVRAGTVNALGNEVVLKTKEGVYAAYCHLNDFSVHVGQKVVWGQKIGRVGHSGMSNNDAHLHFEVRTSPGWKKSWSNFQDPAQWLLGRSSKGWTNKEPHGLT